MADYEISVTDAFGRPRMLTAKLREDNRIVLLCPGEAMVLGPDETGPLIEALRDLREQAFRAGQPERKWR